MKGLSQNELRTDLSVALAAMTESDQERFGREIAGAIAFTDGDPGRWHQVAAAIAHASDSGPVGMAWRALASEADERGTRTGQPGLWWFVCDVPMWDSVDVTSPKSVERKIAALKAAGRAAADRADAERLEMSAILSAARLGASTREIADATERVHTTVSRMIRRQRDRNNS